MQYRTLGRSGLDTSVLSIGAMRLPKDDEEAVALIRRAIDAGCNYIDTSLGYGDSELKLAKALRGGYRERVILSTKCSPWIHQEEGYTASADDTRRKIDQQMRRLEVDYLDFYQVWNVTGEDTYQQAIAPDGVVAGIRRAMDEGLVRHIGATTHAPLDVMHQMIDSGIFEAITVSYYLINREVEEVMEHAHRANVGIVVMNPIGGGLLGADSPVIRGLVPESGLPAAALALRFVLDHPHVTTAISGFAKMSDVEQNVAIANGEPLSSAQREKLAAGVAKLEEKGRKICTQCGYCMPCKQGVLIKDILGLANRGEWFGLLDAVRAKYANFKPEWRADACTQCGACEEKCPNDVPIREQLARAHEQLS